MKCRDGLTALVEEPVFLLMMATICPVYLHLLIYCVQNRRMSHYQLTIIQYSYVMAPPECIRHYILICYFDYLHNNLSNHNLYHKLDIAATHRFTKPVTRLHFRNRSVGGNVLKRAPMLSNIPSKTVSSVLCRFVSE